MSAIVELQGVSKRFGGVQALDEVSFSIEQGEIHGLVGENGAGKSTLIKILGGVYTKDSGQILYQGRPHLVKSPAQAQQSGISIVHQEIPLCPNLTVAQNVFLGHPVLTRWGRADWAAMEERTRDLFAQIGQSSISPRQLVGHLSVAERQLTSIVQALSHDCRLLILDEPTAALTPGEVETLFTVLQRLRDQGTTLVFVSHILSEVMRITDRITVLRNGRHVATRPASELTVADVVRMMVGEVAEAAGDSRATAPSAARSKKPVLQVEGLCDARTGLENVSFELYEQEILGIAGIQGAGRTELALSLFGLSPATSGRITFKSQPVTITSPRQAIDLGIGYLTEDRRHLGLFWDMDVGQNMMAVIVDRLKLALGRLDRGKMQAIGQESVQRLNIRTPGLRQGVRYLSGGNQQKALLARWLNANPSVLILDEPTRGIDVGAKAEIRSLIRELVRQGLSVILISSDLEELLALSDRVLVMSRKSLQGVLERDQATKEAVMALATKTSREWKEA